MQRLSLRSVDRDRHGPIGNGAPRACRRCETHSGAIDLSTAGRSVCTLFGDGAGAVVVSATSEDKGAALCVGRGWAFWGQTLSACLGYVQKPYIPVDDEGFGRVSTEMMFPYMEGKVVFKHAVSRMVEALHEACHAAGVTHDDIDLFCFHQANMRINQLVAQRLGVSEERLVHNIQKFGNTTAATIPLLLAEAERTGRLRPGMKVAMVAFGSGFTWGAAIADW